MDIIDKKTLFNIIYNELGLTKEELRSVILDEFRKVAKKICRRTADKIKPNPLVKCLIEKEVNKIINEWGFYDKVRQEIAKTIHQTLDIKIKKL